MPDWTENKIQNKAITFTDGVLQLLAGPGSGKTYTIIRRIRYLLENGVKPENILVITFTKAAAEEMQQRFYQSNDGYMPPVTFGTFHAVFYHILRQTRQYQSYSLISEKEKRKLLRQILKMNCVNASQKQISQKTASEEKIESLLHCISRIKNEGLQETQIKEKEAIFQESGYDRQEFLKIYNQYQQYLAEFEKLDFDDMGLLCFKLLQENKAVLIKWQQKYRYILIDEFQDINEVQYQIVQLLSGKNPNLFVVGDDDQSIYGFRGAKADMMQRFRKDYPQAKQLLLDTNYRCHEEIVQKSLCVIAENEIRIPKKMQAVHHKGDGVSLKLFAQREEEIEWLMEEIKQKAEKQKNLAQTAIIYRTNYECSMIAEKLVQYRIPFQMKEKLQSPFEHFAIKDCMAYLSFANQKPERALFHLIMNRPLRYLKKDCARKEQTTLQEVLQYYHGNAYMQKTAVQFFEQIDTLRGKRPYLAIQYIRKVIGYDAFLTDTYGIEDGRQIQQLLDDVQLLTKDYKTYQEWSDYISQYEELAKQKKIEYKSETDGIWLMTIHAAKGLEFDTVYLPDLNEHKIPMRQAVTKEEIEEERRMLYVAMTRARNNLYLLACKSKTGKVIPSRFLNPLLTKI